MKEDRETKTIYLRNCYVRTTVPVELLDSRRNGAADTAMGATATANKDAVEKRMIYAS